MEHEGTPEGYSSSPPYLWLLLLGTYSEVQTRLDPIVSPASSAVATPVTPNSIETAISAIPFLSDTRIARRVQARLTVPLAEKDLSRVKCRVSYLEALVANGSSHTPNDWSPTTAKQALPHAEWKSAMEEELASFEDVKVWTLGVNDVVYCCVLDRQRAWSRRVSSGRIGSQSWS